MARSTFSGPILSGSNRFGVQRDVGYTLLSQNCILDFSVTTNGTANYGGASGQFVTSNNVPNNNVTIYVPQSGVPQTPTVSAPTADASGTNYRGCVFYLPVGCAIQDIFVDQIVQPTDGTNAVTAIQPYISNNFATATGVYATSASITGGTVGRTTATFGTATQYNNSLSTLADAQNVNWPNIVEPAFMTQLVVSLKMTVASLGSVNAGKIAVTVRYVQPDTNLGNSTTYPYGNED